MQPSVCFIFTSYLITLQPTPQKPLNLFRKSIPERQHRLLSLRQPELCWRQRPLRIIIRLPWFPADASSAGGCQQMLLGFSFPLCCERRAHLLPPSIPLQAGRLAESCFARARQVSLWDSLKWFWTWIFYLFFFFDTCLFYWLQHDFCEDHRTQSFHLLCSCHVGRNYCQVLLHFLPWRSHENLTWKKTELPAVTW